jgi:membrane protein DedA with SNARE-associated domain
MTKYVPSNSKWMRRIATAVFVIALLPAILFGLRTYNSLLLLRSAHEAGAPLTSSIRPWMTLRYVATRYQVPETGLIMRLGLPSETEPNVSLRSLAESSGQAPFEFVRSVQQAVADVALPKTSQQQSEPSGWFGSISDELVAAVLVYGYPVMALILLFGAVGLPVPTGLSVTLAGSLTASGHMNWLWATVIAVGASIIGDVVGYGLGRLLSQHFLEHHGRWLGYTPRRQARVQALFDRWGAWTIVVTRTLASHLSSVVSLLAGLARYRLLVFLAFDTVGRAIWTSAYFALGYVIGGNLEAATEFLTNLSVLLLSATLLAGAGMVAWGRGLSI